MSNPSFDKPGMALLTLYQEVADAMRNGTEKTGTVTVDDSLTLKQIAKTVTESPTQVS